MDLDLAAEEEEHRLETFNKEEDSRAALLGVNAGTTIGIGSTRPNPADSMVPTGAASIAASDCGVASKSKKRAPRSEVWNDFEELTHVIDGKRVKYGTLCKYYKQTLSPNLVVVLAICSSIIVMLRNNKNVMVLFNQFLNLILMAL
jgi:hypothetical protein